MKQPQLIIYSEIIKNKIVFLLCKQTQNINNLQVFQNLIFKHNIRSSMDNLNQTADMLRERIEELQGKVQTFKTAKAADKGTLAKKYLKQAKIATNLLQSYDYEIQDSQGKPGIQSHQSQYIEFKSRLDKIQKNIEIYRNAGASEEELFKHRDQNGQGIKNIKNQRQQMIQLGHKVQKEGLQAIQRMQVDVQKMDGMADEIQLSLEQQIQKLDGIYDDLQDTNTTLKRAKKHLIYFARNLYTDKILICILVFIILLIIVVIILKIVGKVPSVNNTLIPQFPK